MRAEFYPLNAGVKSTPAGRPTRVGPHSTQQKFCQEFEMLKAIQWFVERLVERLVPIIASSFASTVETMHALGQAEQQGNLEEAARRYEANGMDEVAAVLRERASRLTSDNPASQALPMIENLAGDEERFRRLGLAENEIAESDPKRSNSDTKASRGRRRKNIPSTNGQES